MMLIKRHRHQHFNRGLTLIELLIVMAIVVLLATLTLPSVKNLLKDQRITTTARVVQGLAESARARAIATGRPVALILERARVDAGGGAAPEGLIPNDTCVRISLGEVFPPYEGDWSGSTARMFDILEADGVTTGTDGFVDLMEIDPAQAASLTGATSLVSPGDVVELADRKQSFLVTGTSVAASASGSGAPMVKIFLENPPKMKGKRANEPVWPLTTALAAGSEVRFRIYRKPTKMMAGSVVLPRGACIDLSMSGIGPSGTDFGTNTITPLSLKPSPGPLPGDYDEVYLVFNARGTLDVAYYQMRTNVSGNAEPSVVRVLPNGIFHLLVGRTDQVDPLYGTSSSMASVSTRDDFKPNLLDPANIWVSINPYSGMIYSSQLAVGSGDVASARILASSGTVRTGR